MVKFFDYVPNTVNKGDSIPAYPGGPEVSSARDIPNEDPNAKTKMGLFSAIGEVLLNTAVGIQNPSKLIQDQSKHDAIQAEIEKARAEQAFHQSLMNFASGGEMGMPQPQQISQQNSLYPSMEQWQKGIDPESQGLPSPEDMNVETSKRPDFVTESIKAGGVTMKNVDAAVDAKMNDEAVTESYKKTADFIKQDTSFRKAISLLTGISQNMRGRQEEQKAALGKMGIESSGLGLVPGIVGNVGSALKRPGFGRTSATPGQRKESALAFNNILTGQNKAIFGVIKMIEDTLPTNLDPSDQVASKLAQSITNSYRLTKAFRESTYTPEKLKSMSESEVNNIDVQKLLGAVEFTDDEQAVLDEIIESVLSTPATKSRDLPGLSKEIKASNAELDALDSELADVERQLKELGGI